MSYSHGADVLMAPARLQGHDGTSRVKPLCGDATTLPTQGVQSPPSAIDF